MMATRLRQQKQQQRHAHSHHFIGGLGDGNVHNDYNNNNNNKRIADNNGDDFIARRRRKRTVDIFDKQQDYRIKYNNNNNANNNNNNVRNNAYKPGRGVENEPVVVLKKGLLRTGGGRGSMLDGSDDYSKTHQQRHSQQSATTHGVFIHDGPWQISAIALLGILGLLLALFLHLITGDNAPTTPSKKGYGSRHHRHPSIRTKKKKTDEWSEDELPSDGSHYGPKDNEPTRPKVHQSPIIHIKGAGYQHPSPYHQPANRYANQQLQQTRRHRKVVATSAAAAPTSSHANRERSHSPKAHRPPAQSPKQQKLTYNINVVSPPPPPPPQKSPLPQPKPLVGGERQRSESDYTGLGGHAGLEGFHQQSYSSYNPHYQQQQQPQQLEATRIRPLSPVSSFPSLIGADDSENNNNNNAHESTIPPTSSSLMVPQINNRAAGNSSSISPQPQKPKFTAVGSNSSASGNKPLLVVPGMENWETPRAGPRKTKNIPVQQLEQQLLMSASDNNTNIANNAADGVAGGLGSPFSNEEQLLPFMPSLLINANNSKQQQQQQKQRQPSSPFESGGSGDEHEPPSNHHHQSTIEIESDQEEDEINAHMNLMESGQASLVDVMSITDSKAYPGHPNRNNNNGIEQSGQQPPQHHQLLNRSESSRSDTDGGGGDTDGATVNTTITTTASLSSKEEEEASSRSAARSSSNNPRNAIKHKRPNLTMSTDSESSLHAGSIDFNEIRLQEVIGGGGFGQVWKAMWRGTPVAVKVLSGTAQTENVSKSILEEFAAEINMLKGMRHPNICLYMGACLVPPNRAIVTELAANGSLWDALRLPLQAPYEPCDGMSRKGWPLELYGYNPDGSSSTSSSSPRATTGAGGGQTITNKSSTITLEPPFPPAGTWPWSLVKRVACGAARGMTYLHSGDPPVLHRDLKSANLLLDESYTTKVCDFGLSRLKAQERSMTGNCGTVQWMAPEVLGNQRYAEPADVYSFGIILWELLSRECPYEGMTAIACALAVLNRDHRPPIPIWCPPSLSALINSCVQRNPTKRPTFAQIILALDAMPP